ncbi:MAG: DNA-binding protein WhiA [Clostridia bacterium]|nr:DNA-binding protein WhiA [Clostridia bacterium]
MRNESYSSRIKRVLSEFTPKNGCCRKTQSMLSEALDYPEDFGKAVKCAGKFLCRDCAAAFIRECFIRYGTVTDPEKSYHLEIDFPDEGLRDCAVALLADAGFEAKSGIRKSRYTLYIKNSETLCDLLAFIGAVNASFDFINLKLMKEEAMAINRQTNFETANLQKTVNANRTYISAINFLIESGNFDTLPEDLVETGKLRLEYDTASMSYLGSCHSPTISKSGVKHRLDRLLQISNEIKNAK